MPDSNSKAGWGIILIAAGILGLFAVNDANPATGMMYCGISIAAGICLLKVAKHYDRHAKSVETARAAERAGVAQKQAELAQLGREKQAQAAQLARDEQERRLGDAINNLLSRRSELAARFLEVAARHVARKDQYGLERRRDLPKLIFECISRLAEVEGFLVYLDAPRRYERGNISGLAGADKGDVLELNRKAVRHISVHGPRLYSILFKCLEASFEAYYSSPVDHEPPPGGNVTGAQFELQIAAMLEKCGCQCEMTAATGDQGADLIASYKGRKIAIQAKRWSGTVGNGAVQEVVAALRYYRCREGWVVTNSRFTKSARDLASVHDVVLVEGTELGRLQSFLDVEEGSGRGTLFDN